MTLTGAAGTGKTRLATHAAAELLDEFPDGVFIVDLAPLADPRHVVTTIARTLGLRAADGDAAAEALRSELAGRTLLLVLDNFEHLLPAAPAVADATSATAVTVLATSRAPLRLPGEHVYAVSPCPFPNRSRTPPGCSRSIPWRSS